MSKTNTKATINANIKQNGVQAITGQILNSVLNAMVDDYGEQDELTELESRISYGEYVPMQVTAKTGCYIQTNLTEIESSSFEYAVLDVREGEKYKVSGWNINTNYPLAFVYNSTSSDSRRLYTNNTSTDVHDFEIEIPSGYDKMYVNGRTAIQKVKISKYESTTVWIKDVVEEIQDSKENISNKIDNLATATSPTTQYPTAKAVQDAINNIIISVGGAKPKYGVNVSSSRISVFKRKYNATNDLHIMLMKKAGNNLMDFFAWFKEPNISEDVKTESDPNARVDIVGNTTDWISPHLLYAVNNADGDFPNTTDEKWTGGWHMYNNKTSGDYSATARTAWMKCFVDGIEVTDGTRLGNEVRIEWLNYLQASNTEKANGSGREVVTEHIIVTFNEGNKAIIESEIKALEEVNYKILYGLQSYNGITDGQIYYVSAPTNRGTNPRNTLSRIDGANCGGVKLVGGTDTFEMGIDETYDLGKRIAPCRFTAMTTTAVKSYMGLIYVSGTSTMYNLTQGDVMRWRGFYDCYPTI